jgi:hypothetical protein
MSIDHLDLYFSEANFPSAVKLYETILPIAGFKVLEQSNKGIAFGTEKGQNTLFLTTTQNPEKLTKYQHFALKAQSPEIVDLFYKSATEAKLAQDNGKPGLREDYHNSYYAAFILDNQHNNIECVLHNFNSNKNQKTPDETQTLRITELIKAVFLWIDKPEI